MRSSGRGRRCGLAAKPPDDHVSPGGSTREPFSVRLAYGVCEFVVRTHDEGAAAWKSAVDLIYAKLNKLGLNMPELIRIRVDKRDGKKVFDIGFTGEPDTEIPRGAKLNQVVEVFGLHRAAWEADEDLLQRLYALLGRPPQYKDRTLRREGAPWDF
jgi:hypothetical protein